ncbi:MAG TPA: RHS repeat domain-containing protein [Puia sp.]|jgi:YD repeat-containing protein|nr:RHS repeat domain-containing protein [Puia sp.]
MKFLIGSLFLILLTGVANAQYYYKDIVATRQNIAQWQAYKSARVKSVRLNSFEGDGQPTDGFQIDQTVNSDFSGMTTHSKTNGATETWTFATYSPQGLLTSITDTSDTYQSVSSYQYDDHGRLLSITNTSTETDNHVKAVETHLWQYASANDQPTGMLKIMNGTDTTYIRFVPDDKGNIGEEHATRNQVNLPTIYYYYDDANRLTDIVRYNLKARRLLPDNILEYGADGRVTSLIAVQEGAGSYQKWMYDYNDKGLKTKESCFTKQREMVGHVEYQYTYK